MNISKEKRVRDVMTRGVITAPFDTPVSEIAKLLVREHISVSYTHLTLPTKRIV